MKVYEYGHIKPMYAFCSGCGAILEFNSRETKKTNRCIEGKYHYINCPICGRVIFDGNFKASPEDC